MAQSALFYSHGQGEGEGGSSLHYSIEETFGGSGQMVDKGETHLIYRQDLPPCFFLRTEMTPCRLPLVEQIILRSPHCSTLLNQSTRLERQRTQAQDSLELDLPQVVVFRGSFKN